MLDRKKDGKYIVDPHFQQGVSWESIERRVPAKVEGHKPKTDTRKCNQGLNCWCKDCPITETPPYNPEVVRVGEGDCLDDFRPPQRRELTRKYR